MKKPEWKKKPEAKDYAAAHNYLSLLFPDEEAKALHDALKKAKPIARDAKDLLRASGLPLLPHDEPHVDADLRRIHRGKALSPVLLVQGNMKAHTPLIVADGYHRICAICYFDENAPVPCPMVPCPV